MDCHRKAGGAGRLARAGLDLVQRDGQTEGAADPSVWARHDRSGCLGTDEVRAGAQV